MLIDMGERYPGKQSLPTLHVHPDFIWAHKVLLNRIKEKSGWDMEIEKSWINYTDGKETCWHSHPGCDYAGVFWIKSSKGCGDLEFHSPSHHSQYNECMSYTEIFQKESGCFPSASISPVPGKIFIFPASLYHQVQTSHSNEDRISSSFNITIYY